MNDIQDISSQEVIIVEDDTLREGFTQIPNAILRRNDVSAGAKLAYMGLLSYAWQKGSCFPGQARLAEDLGISKRSVVTYMQELQRTGLLRIKRRGLGKTNIYFLPKYVPSRSAKSALQEVQETTPPEVQNLHIEEDSYKKTQKKTDESLSKIRKVQSLQKTIDEHNAANQHNNKSSAKMESVGDILKRELQPSKQRAYDENRQALVEYIGDFSLEFNDQASLKSSTTRAENLLNESGVSLDIFIGKMYEARALTKERTSMIRSSTSDPKKAFPTKNKMAYFFAILEERLGLRPAQIEAQTLKMSTKYSKNSGKNRDDAT